MTEALLVALVFVVGGCLLLYLLVRNEASGRRVVDREEAERAARRDADDVSDRR